MFKLFAGHNDEFLKMDSLSLPERMPANGASCLTARRGQRDQVVVGVTAPTGFLIG